MTASVLREKVIEEINQIPEEKLTEVYDFIHFFRIGLQSSKQTPKTQEILNAANNIYGLWEDREIDVDEYIRDLRIEQRTHMAKLTLQQISQNTYFIPSPANIGVYVEDQQVILIDSGNDKEAGRQILKLLKEQHWQLKLIINTHSNADHIGGNAFLQQKTHCRIAATQMEAAFIQTPELEPAFLFGGFPMKALRNKFLMAKPSTVTDLIPSAGPILDTELEAIPLPGHYFDMIGIKTPDDVLFLADTLFSEQIIAKYHFFFLYDIQAHLDTLAKLPTLQAAYHVPSHDTLLTDITSLLEVNQQNIHEIIDYIASCCQTPTSFEAILEQVCTTYNIELNANQYVLVGSTIKSYLAYLTEQGRVAPVFSDGKLLWHLELERDIDEELNREADLVVSS